MPGLYPIIFIMLFCNLNYQTCLKMLAAYCIHVFLGDRRPGHLYCKRCGKKLDFEVRQNSYVFGTLDK